MGEAMTPRSAGIVHRVADDLLQGWDEGFDRMSLAMGSSESPSDVARLRGGLEAETFAFRLAGDRFVVKIYDVDSADQASTEFDNLGVVSLARVATPEPVLMDHNGEWFRTPAIVMSALPGQPDMRPSDRQRWTDGAAEALASIHEIPPARTTDARLPRWQRWWPSTDGMGSDSSRADLLLAQFHEEAGRLPVVVSHDDFNPGNLLFDGGRLSGVVDWADIVVEPRHAAERSSGIFWPSTPEARHQSCSSTPTSTPLGPHSTTFTCGTSFTGSGASALDWITGSLPSMGLV